MRWFGNPPEMQMVGCMDGMAPAGAPGSEGDGMVEAQFSTSSTLRKTRATTGTQTRETKAKEANYRGPKSSSLTRPPHIARLVRKPSEQCPQKVL